jgi:hypothetical protein
LIKEITGIKEIKQINEINEIHWKIDHIYHQLFLASDSSFQEWFYRLIDSVLNSPELTMLELISGFWLSDDCICNIGSIRFWKCDRCIECRIKNETRYLRVWLLGQDSYTNISQLSTFSL